MFSIGKRVKNLGSVRALLRAVLVWGACAFLLLALASLILTKASAGSEILGYCSSAISFICAAAAGFSASQQRRDMPLWQGALIAIILVILLLTLGFLVRGKNLNPSGIMSVVSFTFAGTLLGALAARKGRGKKRKRGRGLRRIS